MSSVAATVIATFSRRMRLALADGREVEARIKGKRLRPVCGDRVAVEQLAGETDWLITGIEGRRNELARPNMRGQVEVLAANLDYVVVVTAAEPRPDWFIVDRYLCAAELMGARAAVVFNKTDLVGPDPEAIAELENYAAIGYDTATCSAETHAGIDKVHNLLKGHTAIIVGQSGVGKSSIINAVLEDELQKTSEISAKTGEGRHTTVNSVMISLPGGGAVIDSPGVRDYAPALESSISAPLGFREISNQAAHCRFANCRHLREPGCAVKAACDAGEISGRRYESYRRIVNLTEKLTAGRY